MNDLTRRNALVGLGAAGLAAALAACSKAADSLTNNASPSSTSTGSKAGSSTSNGSTSNGSTRSTPSTSGSSSSSSGAGAADGAACTVTPELTEGPYYLDLDLIRQDIREGRPGAPLKLTMTAVDTDGCTPLKNAAIDIWHCDALGDYSGVNNAGGPGGGGGGRNGRNRSPGNQSSSGSTSGTFLRGTQVTNDQGVVEFLTIYPGYYSGRAVHIHFKVHPDANREMTGQLFFPDDLNTKVFSTQPYAQHGQPDRPNSSDSIYQQSRGTTLLKPTSDGDGYAAAITIGVGASTGGQGQRQGGNGRQQA